MYGGWVYNLLAITLSISGVKGTKMAEEDTRFSEGFDEGFKKGKEAGSNNTVIILLVGIGVAVLLGLMGVWQ